MAELATIARPYANAVFDLAKRDSSLEQWSRMLAVLDATAADDTVALLMNSPDLPSNAKAYRLAELCGDELDDRGKKFVQSLADHDRLPLIAEVREQFEVLRAEEQKSLEVEVATAYDLSDAESERLKDALNRKFAKEISIETRVDESLIGGAVIRAGDMVIDGSVRGKLQKLAETLEQL
jgi:F-type H+-transporting ATPase subunit delta